MWSPPWMSILISCYDGRTFALAYQLKAPVSCRRSVRDMSPVKAKPLAALILLSVAITAVTSNGQVDPDKTGGPPDHVDSNKTGGAASHNAQGHKAELHLNEFDPAPVNMLRGGRNKTEKSSSSGSQSSSAVGDSNRKESPAQSPSPSSTSSPLPTRSPSLQSSPSPSVSEKSKELRNEPKSKANSAHIDPDKTGGSREPPPRP